jgi:hypothetical protein
VIGWLWLGMLLSCNAVDDRDDVSQSVLLL